MNDEELYAEPAEAEAEAAEPSIEKEEAEPKEDSYSTELISKESLGLDEGSTIKPGQTFTFEAVKDFGKNVELRCLKKKVPTEDEELAALAE